MVIMLFKIGLVRLASKYIYIYTYSFIKDCQNYIYLATQLEKEIDRQIVRQIDTKQFQNLQNLQKMNICDGKLIKNKIYNKKNKNSFVNAFYNILDRSDVFIVFKIWWQYGWWMGGC